METVKLLAPAKINLTLDIVGKRQDGYHFVSMIMQSIDLYDEITLSLNLSSDISITCSNPIIPTDERNIVYKATREFFDYCSLENTGVFINIEKNIPTEAGLAGGSTDAAAVILGLDSLFRTGFTNLELSSIAQKVGADVAFCLSGGTALAEGIGELITTLPNMPDCSILIVKPKAGVKTQEAYERFDLIGTDYTPETEKVVAAIVSGDLEGIGLGVCNVLEKSSQIDEIDDIKKHLIEYGAVGASMTGSGSAVFGIFENKSDAKKAARNIEDLVVFSQICEPISSGVIIQE